MEWTLLEENRLREMLDTHSNAEIGAAVGRSEKAVKSKLRRTGLRKPQHGGWRVDRQNRGGGLWAYCWTGEKA